MAINWGNLFSDVTTLAPIILAFINSLKGGTTPPAARASCKASLVNAGVLEADALKLIAWAEANQTQLETEWSGAVALLTSLQAALSG